MKGGKKMGFSGGPWNATEFDRQWVRRCKAEETH